MQKYAVTIIAAVLLGVSIIIPKHIFAYVDLQKFSTTHTTPFSTHAPYVSINNTKITSAAPIAAKVTQPKPQYKNTPTYVTESRLLIELNKLKAELIQPTSPIFVSSQSDRLADSLSRNFTAQVNTVTSDSVAKGGDAALGTLTVNQLVSSGNVGVGTVSPMAKLDVAGQSRFTGITYTTLSGTADPDGSKTLTGSGTQFTTELLVGDRITINGESRSVTSIISNTSLTVDTAFTDTSSAGISRQPYVLQARLSDNTPALTLNDAGNLVIGNLPEVGTIVPQSKLYVVDNSSATYTAVFESDSDSANGAYLSLRHARGTPTAPTDAQNGDSNYIYGGFYNGGRFWNGGQISFVLDGAVVPGSRPPTSLTFSTNSGISVSERMRISPTGNVGIGTTTPAGKLHIKTALTDTPGNSSSAIVLGQFGIAPDYAAFRLGTNGSLNIDSYLSSWATSMTITRSGNVGIGTATPTSLLTLAASTTVSGGITFGTDTNLYRSAADTLRTDDSLSVSGFLNMSNQIQALSSGGGSSQTLPSYAFASDTNTGMFTPSLDTIGFTVGGTEKVRIDSAGRVGIGTTTPTQPLHVIGNIQLGSAVNANAQSPVGGILRFNGSDGTSDTVGTIGWYGEGAALQGSMRLVGGNSSSARLVMSLNTSGNSFKDIYTFGNGAAGSYFTVGNVGGTVSGNIAAYNTSSGSEVTNLVVGNMDTSANSNSSIRFSSYDSAVMLAKIVAEKPNGASDRTGNLNFYTNDNTALTSKMVIKGGTGNVGIGTTTPGQKLTVVGSAQFTNVISGTYGSDLNLTADGTLTKAASDIRLKENLEALNSSSTLDKILQLKPYNFTWINDPTHRKDVGLIAQDVATIFPEITFTNESDGFMGINYSRLPALLVAGMQEIMHMIAGLAEKVTTKLVEAVRGVFDRVETKTLCLEDLCITKDELKDVLSELKNKKQIINISQPNTVPTPTPTDTTSTTTPEVVDSSTSETPTDPTPTTPEPTIETPAIPEPLAEITPPAPVVEPTPVVTESIPQE